jgi:hypothetical protein
MEYPPDLVQRWFVRFDRSKKLGRREVIVEEQWGKILPFVVFSKFITNQDISKTELVEAPDQRASDEAGAAGDQDLALF